MKIASFTFKGKHYTITSSDWFWTRVRRYKFTIAGAACIALALFVLVGCAAAAGPLDETRYGGPPKRDANGQIIRRADVIATFKRIHPCPVTGLKAGACPRWQINHAIPLACGGVDAVSNLYWAPVQIKTCKEAWCIDRYERKVYEAPYPIADTAACKNEVIKP